MIDDSGIVYSFGSNRDGQLGLGFNDFNPHPEPTAISFVNDLSGQATPVPNLRGTVIYCGGYHNIAITAKQDIYIWGWTNLGSLDSVTPTAWRAAFYSSLFCIHFIQKV
jgi:alpha-tubulin suppressor-like RCC1 family protein